MSFDVFEVGLLSNKAHRAAHGARPPQGALGSPEHFDPAHIEGTCYGGKIFAGEIGRVINVLTHRGITKALIHTTNTVLPATKAVLVSLNGAGHQFHDLLQVPDTRPVQGLAG